MSAFDPKRTFDVCVHLLGSLMNRWLPLLRVLEHLELWSLGLVLASWRATAFWRDFQLIDFRPNTFDFGP
jgi:hypothetical protein